MSIPTYDDGRPSFWFKRQQGKFNQAKLSDLTVSKDSLHFRFSTETQAVDVWTSDFKTFCGTLANFTTSQNEDKKGNSLPEEFYSDKTELDTATARQIYKIFEGLSIFSIPTEDSIEGWGDGMDGEQFLIEHSTPTQYSFKEYWTPRIFKDSIKEAAAIDSLENLLETTLQMQKAFGIFIRTLPAGTYSSNGFFIISTYGPEKRKKGKAGKFLYFTSTAAHFTNSSSCIKSSVLS